MKRQVLGVLAATIAAPYLFSFLWILFGFIAGDRPIMKEPLDLIKAIPMGTMALIVFGIPLLILASLCATAVNAIERPTWRGPMLGGTIFGLGFIFALSMGAVAYNKELIALQLSGTCSGAICGWIYWRIAMHRHSPSETTLA
ncbi:hypothetical protein [Microvirga flavescens]|uniref:hypothetical protein n=1 Tax=Microvirga flavescens TaxID=2249811 RepID=UPI000DDA6E1F|nr:hypothetical protein [Microvirga flavescens]